MHPVDYANRNSGLAWVDGTARPGDYYVAVSRRAAYDDEDQGVLPVHLQIAVVGKAGVGAPSYEKGAATGISTPSASSSSSTPSTAVAAGSPVTVTSAGSNWPLIGGVSAGVVVLAGVGAAAANAARRRH